MFLDYHKTYSLKYWTVSPSVIGICNPFLNRPQVLGLLKGQPNLATISASVEYTCFNCFNTWIYLICQCHSQFPPHELSHCQFLPHELSHGQSCWLLENIRQIQINLLNKSQAPYNLLTYSEDLRFSSTLKKKKEMLKKQLGNIIRSYWSLI